MTKFVCNRFHLQYFLYDKHQQLYPQLCQQLYHKHQKTLYSYQAATRTFLHPQLSRYTCIFTPTLHSQLVTQVPTYISNQCCLQFSHVPHLHLHHPNSDQLLHTFQLHLHQLLTKCQPYIQQRLKRT